MKKPEQPSEIPESVLKRWWWRRLVFVKFDQETHTTQWQHHVPEHSLYGFSSEWNSWHRKDELIAFRFELLRRISFPELPEWIHLPVRLNSWVTGILSPKPERSVCGLFAPVAPPNYVSFDWMWDLEASDEALCQRFIMFINEERQRNNLPTSDIIGRIMGKQQKYKEKRRGERNRQVSWLAVEAFDLKLHKVRPLSDGERSRLSKAYREIKTFEKPLKEAMEIDRQNTPENYQDPPYESLYARFVRENFLKCLASRIKKG
ncbi:MAG TPA: hypothetical protein VG347_17555 [Verrucomicrobiae bacterium]|nr:hypothetical protein [Verrucomicrobiae bacterium]